MFALLLLATVAGAGLNPELAAEIQQAQTLLVEGRPREAAQHFARLREDVRVTGHDRVTVVSNLAIAHLQSGRLEAAETSFAEAHRLLSAGPAAPKLQAPLWNAEAMLARQRGQLTRARALHTRVEELTRHSDPVLYAISLGNHAELERTLGDPAEAERLARRAILMLETNQPAAAHHRTSVLHTLGLILQTQGRCTESVAALEEAWRARRGRWGAYSRATAASQAALASSYIACGQLDQAQTMLTEARLTLDHHLGPQHPEVAAVWNNLAQVAKLSGRFAEADPLYRRALDIWAQSCGKSSREYGLGLANFGDFFLAQGKGRGAAKLYEQAERILSEVLGAGHPQTQAVSLRRAQAHAARDRQTTGHTLRHGVAPIR